METTTRSAAATDPAAVAQPAAAPVTTPATASAMAAAAAAAPAASAVEPPAQAPGAHGYWLSSLELRRGVEVKAIGVRAVPTEALRELLRMRESWRHPAAPQAAAAAGGHAGEGGASGQSGQSAFELDIALEADGRVTLPGDLVPLAA
ncbi:MAG: hypothetical protein JNL85_05070 [Rubrivivax sp.]|nr:hypothetical protein [Rubrivivax sp.]